MSGDHTLSNVAINAHFRADKRYGGCFSKDRLPKAGPQGKFYVINLQDENGGDRLGTHWVCLIDCPIPDKNPDYAIFFDPYGIPPAPAIVAFLAKSDKPNVWITCQYQALDSSACGYYCIRVLEAILNSTPYQDIFNSSKGMREGAYAQNEKYALKE